ncbi:ATP-binding protein [Sulfurisphaera ohwakuensis]|uniref:AAA family ATPase n=1 Tax=Sulfurisphaera ohwakuensis TaxID=69656 RepID=UPI0036F249F2
MVIMGLRRTGKTSLVRSVLNEEKVTYIFLDMRRFENKEYIVYKDFIQVLEKEINRIVKKNRDLISHLQIRGVQIMGISVNFSWGRDKVELSDIFSSLNDWGEEKGKTVHIVIDEAQELIKLKGYNVLYSIAYAFDNLKKLNFIITGSEVRVKDKFLKLQDEESPLFGRTHIEINIKPFDKETAIRFLEEGFREQRINFEDKERVYDILGGNPGWLTYFGYVYIKTKDEEKAIVNTKKYAKKLLSREFCNFLKEGGRDKRRYLKVIETCKEGCRWKDIKNSLEALEGREINDGTVRDIVNNLLEYSFLIKEDKEYIIADKLLREISDLRC